MRYDPIGLEGEVLENTVEVSVSKNTVTEVQLKRDEVRIESKRALGKPAPIYTVHEILEGRDPGAGRWILRCWR